MAIELTDIGDPHVHVRQNKREKKDGTTENTALLDFSVPHTAAWASFMLPMPNTVPSIRTGSQAVRYADEIRQAGGQDMHIIMCIKAVEGFTTTKTIYDAKKAGVGAIKIYFEGTTTNAYEGDAVSWDGFFKMERVWQVCQDVDMVVCIHPEKPGAFSLEREFLTHYALEWLTKLCPRLRVVVEHITDARTVRLVKQLPDNVGATITAHHLWGDLDMVIGGNLDPHAFCKPPAKWPRDCKALRRAAMSGNPKFMFGSDSALHPADDKHFEGCAGCFTAPFCPQMVAHVLEEEGCEDIQGTMQKFMGDFARDFYRVPATGKRVTLEREPFPIPSVMYTSAEVEVIPFMADSTLRWRMT